MQPEKEIKLQRDNINIEYKKDEAQSVSHQVTKDEGVEVLLESEKMIAIMTKWIWGECPIKG